MRLPERKVLKFLKEILIAKKKQMSVPGTDIYKIQEPSPDREERRSFSRNIIKGKVNVIAEIKKASPSRGIINEDLDIEKTVLAYEAHKSFISAISVLTEPLYFMGAPGDIGLVKRNTGLPVLRKDFIFSEMQIVESFNLGADCVLLISSLLGSRKLKRLYDAAVSLGMEVLIEAHDMRQLDKALDTGSRLIGINNRDLKKMKVDSGTITSILDNFNESDLEDKVLVCESGIKDTDYMKKLFDRGVYTFLIGGHFMASRDLEDTLGKMESQLRTAGLI